MAKNKSLCETQGLFYCRSLSLRNLAEFVAVSKRKIFPQVRKMAQIFFVGDVFFRRVSRVNQNIVISKNICNLQIGQAVLSLAEKLPGTAQLQIFFGKFKAVVRRLHRRQAFFRVIVFAVRN